MIIILIRPKLETVFTGKYITLSPYHPRARWGHYELITGDLSQCICLLIQSGIVQWGPEITGHPYSPHVGMWLSVELQWCIEEEDRPGDAGVCEWVVVHEFVLFEAQPGAPMLNIY